MKSYVCQTHFYPLSGVLVFRNLIQSKLFCCFVFFALLLDDPECELQISGHSLKLIIAFHFVFSCFEGYNATILAYGQVVMFTRVVNLHIINAGFNSSLFQYSNINICHW